MNIYTARFGRQIENGDILPPWQLPSRPRFRDTTVNQATFRPGDEVYISDEDLKAGVKPPDGYQNAHVGDPGYETFTYVGDGGAAAAEEYNAILGGLAEGQIAAAEAQTAIAEDQNDLSKERYKYWEREFKPTEKALNRAARVGIDPNYAAARAGADVTAAFDKSSRIQDRDMMRAGIDPSSPKYQQMSRQLSIARAAAEAGARNQARTTTQDVNYGRLYQSAQLGRDIPAQAMSQAGLAAQTYGAAAGTLRGAASTYGQGFNATMQSNQMALDASQFQQQMAFQQNQLNAQNSAAGMNAVGQLVGTAGTVAALSFCWVAREVYGATNAKWLWFRHWMLNVAPAWFRSLYIQHGPRVAEWLRGKTSIKTLIRVWMDARIHTLQGASA